LTSFYNHLQSNEASKPHRFYLYNKLLFMIRFIFILTFLFSSPFIFAQEGDAIEKMIAEQDPTEIACSFGRVADGYSISEFAIDTAETLQDLNPYFKSAWVKEYLKVEIITLQDGKKISAFSKSQKLTKDQKLGLINADDNSDIEVLISYLPDNNLVKNEPKKADFTLLKIPGNEAQFKGGLAAFRKYMESEAFDLINGPEAFGKEITAIRFTVNDSGQITEVEIQESSNDFQIDEILKQAICSMPEWQPAEFKSGRNIDQTFVFTAGNLQSCKINLLGLVKQ